MMEMANNTIPAMSNGLIFDSFACFEESNLRWRWLIMIVKSSVVPKSEDTIPPLIWYFCVKLNVTNNSNWIATVNIARKNSSFTKSVDRCFSLTIAIGLFSRWLLPYSSWYYFVILTKNDLSFNNALSHLYSIYLYV